MIQGTASDVGKSLFQTVLCRLFALDGYRVAPFKSQNMSNNTYVLKDGKEISKAQALQAEAAKVEPTIWMNPLVLKPKTDSKAELIVLGELTNLVSGRNYRENFYEKGVSVIKQSLQRLSGDFDVVVLEGAGSPVEINLKDKELVNMKVAELADVPVILVADIDRGGVFASIVGTLELLTTEERKRVRGIIINKFRGDLSLFTEGLDWLEEKVDLPILGVVPYIEHNLEAEDSLSAQSKNSVGSAPVDYSERDESYNRLAKEVKKHINYEQIKTIMYEWKRIE